MSDPFASRSRSLVVRAGLVLAVVAATGCQGGTGILRRWSMQDDPTLAKPITRDELGDNRGMIARWLSPEKAPHTGGKTNAALVLNSGKPDPETEAEIGAAEALFQQGKLAEAEAAFARLEKKKTASAIPVDEQGLDAPHRDQNLWERLKGDSTKKTSQPAWGEKVLFYLAECQYQQGKFVAANDTYERLLNTYPASPHLEKAVQREYSIALDWLAAGQEQAPPTEGGDVAGEGKADAAVSRASWLDHFNGRRPMVDVNGYAIKALEHVRQHDPTGPLADDAALAIAEYHLKKEVYEDASVYFDQMILDHPKSPLLQRAMLGSIDAKIKGYLGPQYDSDGLEKARALIERTKTYFPDRSPELSAKLDKDLALIANQQAEIAFREGEFYKRTGYVSGAEMSFGKVQALWPSSEWAGKAKVQMASLAKMKRKVAAPSRILTLPGAPDPTSQANNAGGAGGSPNGMGGAGGMSGMSGP